MKLNDDIRESPAYSFPEAAHYLGIPRNTLRAWTLGQRYRVGERWATFDAIITPADSDARLLSFMNLIEAHVLDALRHQHKISLQRVRKALDYLSTIEDSKHPLATNAFATHGLTLFVEKYGELLNLTQAGQLAVLDMLRAYLRRVDRDTSGLPIRLYPFTRGKEFDEPRKIVIDPTIAFGRPVIGGVGVPTRVIVERLKGGESIDSIARDYELDQSQVEEAIRCEIEAA